MADITNLFKATVKTIKARQKAQGVTGGSEKHPILAHAKAKTEFATKAKDVVNGITKLRDFLANHRKDYINACSLLTSEVSKMTDAERDQIDSDAQTFMRTCSDAIKALKTEASSAKVLPQVKEHREVVFSLMETYLKGVCNQYSEQRAVRVKRVVDRKRISRLEPEKKKFKTFETDDTEEKGLTEDMEIKSGSLGSGDVMSMDDLTSPTIEDEELSPEEALMFEQENEQLFQEMNSIVDEVRQIEGKVVEISRLQEIFTDKIMEQEKDIDRIAETAVGTTENIKEANEEIREAMKNNAGLRVWILFFLIVCSLSLLFLDWYNA